MLACVLIILGNIQVKTEQKEKKEEEFKIGTVIKNNYGNLLEIVPYKEFRAWKIEKGYWSSGFTAEYEKTTLYYCKNQKGTYYSTECKKDVTKVTKIEEFIFKNGGKENE
jgi:hypothetical protein